MTRSELIARLVHSQQRLTTQDAATCVDEILSAIAAQLSRGKRVEIRGFGSYSVGQRNARVGRNPKTGERVEVQAKMTIRFKAGMELRMRVNRG